MRNVPFPFFDGCKKFFLMAASVEEYMYCYKIKAIIQTGLHIIFRDKSYISHPAACSG